MDIDSATIELAKSYGGLPPKLRYRFRRFLQKLVSKPEHPKNPEERQRRIQEMAGEMVKMIQEEYGTPLAKNEFRCSTYDNGCIRLDFGEDVPDSIKKAAIAWAKSRGLSAVEASVMKSMKSSEYVIMSQNNTRPNNLVSVVSKTF